MPSAFSVSLDELLREKLDLVVKPIAAIEDRYGVIDVSGSMRGKSVDRSPVLMDLLRTDSDRVKLWSYSIQNADAFRSDAVIEGSGTENPAALVRFAETLPRDAKITLVTDDSGRDAVIRYTGIAGIAETERARDRAAEEDVAIT